MPAAELKLVKRWTEFRPKDQINMIPLNTCGIYALLMKKPNDKFDVVYVGMAGGKKAGVRGRLRVHSRSKKKRFWTHFSIFEVWDNVTEPEVAEVEGLFRTVYRKDSQANSINKQKWHRKLGRVRIKSLKKW